MSLHRRMIRLLQGLGLGAALVAWATPARAQDSTKAASWAVRLHWQSPADSSRARTVSADAPLELGVTLTGADTLRGFQAELTVRPASKSTAWLFESSRGCSAALLEAFMEGDSAAPAPWRGKLTMAQARPAADSTVRLIVTCAFNPELLNPARTYTLCRLRLTPPQPAGEASCPGWDAAARIELKRVQILLLGFRTAWAGDLGPPLEVSFRSAQ